MFLDAVVLVACPALFVAGAVTDLVSFKIPNWIPAALAAAFALAAALAAMPLGEIGWHALVCLAALVIGMGLFAGNLIGGGDAKLLAAAALWMGPHFILLYCMVFALVGGAFAIAILWLRRAPLPAMTARLPFLNELLRPKAGLPYGVALGIGALIVLPKTPLFLAAFSS
ncbi:MAG: prepilin peptidase [Alphaproteobacteria bacterium]|nr:prepilin peptidase [Alphaproteobacteria bacterium]